MVDLILIFISRLSIILHKLGIYYSIYGHLGLNQDLSSFEELLSGALAAPWT